MSFIVSARSSPGREAVSKNGWWVAHRWLLLRRLSQTGILLLFVLGPWFGVWVIKGNLSSSVLLDVVPMTDPFVLLQSLATGHWPYTAAWTGVGIVVAFYLLVGGRAYCSWVCPVNLVTDAASALRRRIGLKTGRTPPKQLRYWLLAATLGACAIVGTVVWEWINPVSMLHRAVIFGGGLAWLVVAGVFLYDLILAPRGWCGHVCPMGACYATINRASLLRIATPKREACTDCMDCFAVCPEPHVIRPALKGAGSTLITAPECTNCGRCIDVCAENVFSYSLRNSRLKTRREGP